MKLICKTDKVKTLTKGVAYYGKMDNNGQLRVKGNDGKWNKYSTKNFDVVELTQEDLDMISKISKTANVLTNIPTTTISSETPKTTIEEQFKESKEKVEQQIKNVGVKQPVAKKKITLKDYLVGQGVPSNL